jgi:hypothetical protein
MPTIQSSYKLLEPEDVDLSAFWLYPDWDGPLKEPFWMRPLKVPEVAHQSLDLGSGAAVFVDCYACSGLLVP